MVSVASGPSPSVVTWTDQPRSGESLKGWTMNRLAARTRGSFSMAFMRRKTARMGARMSIVVPPPRIMGSERHADVAGHAEESPLKDALAEVGEKGDEVRVLGSYPVAIL